MWRRSEWYRGNLLIHGYPSRSTASALWWYNVYKRDSCLKSKLYDIIHKNGNLYPLNSYKIGENILKTINSDTNKIVTPRPKGRTCGKYRVSLGGPRFPGTPFKNPYDIHQYQNPFEKWIPKPIRQHDI